MKDHFREYKYFLYLFILFLSLGVLLNCSSQNETGMLSPNPNKEADLLPEDQVRLSNSPKKTEIFRDAGLGLFIHWGPNSQMGTEISWPLNNASDDYVERYFALAETFNPQLFNPAQWARLGKLAGIEYVVFTAKHHDGFAMFDTAYSDFKITNTPFARDIVAMVADAFRKENILVGFYYSPGDFRYQWETNRRPHRLMEPDFASSVPFGPLQKSFVDYECGQVEELLRNYGDIFMLWFDGQCDPLKKRAWSVNQDIFIGRGEIPTPEQNIPGHNIPGRYYGGATVTPNPCLGCRHLDEGFHGSLGLCFLNKANDGIEQEHPQYYPGIQEMRHNNRDCRSNE